MKKTLLSKTLSIGMVVFSTVALTTILSTAAVAQQQPQSGPALQAAIAQERRAELASKYGLSQAQIDQVEELQRQSEVKYDQINKLQIPSKDRGEKVGEVKRAFQAQVKEVMTPEQYDRWMADQQQQKEAVDKLRKERADKLKQIESSTISESQKIDQRKVVEAEFQTAVVNLVGPAKGAEIINRQNAIGNWYINNNKGLDLTRSEADVLAFLAADKDQKVAAVEAQNLSNPEERRALESIKNDYNTKVRQALGDQKFAVWSRNNANQMDYNLKNKYGMNPEQIRQYKAIVSEHQVAKMKLAQATMSPEEKAVKRDSIERQYNEKLQQVLLPQQYGKVAQEGNYRKQKIAQKRAKLGPRPMPQGGSQTATLQTSPAATQQTNTQAAQ